MSSSDRPFYDPEHAGVRPRPAAPGERLWTVSRKGHTYHAELRSRPDDRCELQLFVDDEFRWGQLFLRRDLAEAEGAVKLEVLRQDGWEPPV